MQLIQFILRGLCHFYNYLTDYDVTPRRGNRTKKLSSKAQEALLSTEDHSDLDIPDEIYDTEILKPSGTNKNIDCRCCVNITF